MKAKIVQTWVCGQCTALNQDSYYFCSVCGYTKQTTNTYCLMSCKHIRVSQKILTSKGKYKYEGASKLMIPVYFCAFFQVALEHENDDLFKPVLRHHQCKE